MPLILLSMLGGVKTCFTAVFGFLAKLNPWQLLCLALAVLILVQHFQVISWKHSAAKWQAQYTTLHTQFDNLAKQSKLQQQSVTRTVNHYLTVDRPVVEKEVQRIESAPVVPGCKTPPAILGADL